MKEDDELTVERSRPKILIKCKLGKNFGVGTHWECSIIVF